MRLLISQLRVPYPPTRDILRSTAVAAMLSEALILVVIFGVSSSRAEESLQLSERWRGLYPSRMVKKSNESKITGDSIWSDCSDSGDSVKILSISVTPDPPEKGQQVSADVKLDFTEQVEGGSLNILVKYNNYFPVMNKKRNLCNIPDILDDPCPLTSGVHEATFVHKFPSYAPSGTYVGKVVAKDKSGNELMCVRLNFSV